MCQTFVYLIKLNVKDFFFLERSNLFMSFDFSQIYMIISSYLLDKKSKQIIVTNKDRLVVNSKTAHMYLFATWEKNLTGTYLV